VRFYEKIESQLPENIVGRRGMGINSVVVFSLSITVGCCDLRDLLDGCNLQAPLNSAMHSSLNRAFAKFREGKGERDKSKNCFLAARVDWRAYCLNF
jgi:hypothetical protein